MPLLASAPVQVYETFPEDFCKATAAGLTIAFQTEGCLLTEGDNRAHIGISGTERATLEHFQKTFQYVYAACLLLCPAAIYSPSTACWAARGAVC